MVWLNDQHFNQTPPPGTFGGSRCTCKKCEEERRGAPRAEKKAGELLPCPFCGGEAVINKLSNIYQDVYSVSCLGEIDNSCHGLNGGGYNEDMAEAIRCWNKRNVTPS